MLEECASCIEQAFEHSPMSSVNVEEQSISNRMKKLGIITHLRMQYCAILSQIHRHKDAMTQAKVAVRLATLLINDMRDLCVLYIKKEEIHVA
jgi:hypothetical protein